MFLLNRSRCDDLHQNCLSQRRHVLCNTAHDGHEKAPVVIVGTAARTLQAATYLAQGKIWRTVGRMAETHLDDIHHLNRLDEWKSKIQSFAKHLSGDGGGSQVHAALPSRNRAEWRKEEKE